MNKEIETFKVFVTKYALTQGIFETEVRNSHVPNMVVETNKRYYVASYFSPHWHLTKESAIEHAEEMRIKKLKSLDKQIKKLSSLKFD